MIIDTLIACESYFIVPEKHLPKEINDEAIMFGVSLNKDKKCLMALQKDHWEKVKHEDIRVLMKQVDPREYREYGG